MLATVQRCRDYYLRQIIIIIISGFGIYGAAVVPDSGVGNIWQRLTLVLHEFLSNGLTPSRLHIVISFLTHADHVYLGLPRFLVPGTPNRVMELMQEVVNAFGGGKCICPRLSVCLLARLLKNAQMDLDEILCVDRCRDMDELINF